MGIAGDLVREARRRGGLTQRQLASRAGTTQASIARLEAGHVDAPLDRVVHLLRASGFDLDVRVVPSDDDAWALAQQSLALSPEQRIERVERMLEFHDAGRRARGETGLPRFEPIEMLRTLHGHGVVFVVVGGYGSILHGAPHVTDDLDIVPEMGVRNLERLSGVLGDLDARIRTPSEPDGVPFDHHARSLEEVRVWNLVTSMGNLDLTFIPSGTNGYEDLRRDLVLIRVHDVDVPVASLADIIRSKEAAGRERDRAILPTLRRLLAERRREGGAR
jgi:transcriptional regulator with XRE-family HTH domain